MRPAHWMVLPLCGLLAVACASKSPFPEAAPEDVVPTPTAGKTPSTTTTAKTDPTTCLGKVGLSFENAACNTCMQVQDCCDKTIACVKTNPDCVPLHECMVACNGGTVTKPTTDGGADSGAGSAAKALFTTEVYPTINTTCGTCHRAGGGGPTFFGADAAARVRPSVRA